MNPGFRYIIPVVLSLLSGAFLPASAQKKEADLRLNTIVIDPGHGGKDPGTVSADKKTYEKTLSLKISKQFADKVREAYPDMKVILTRDKDVFIPLNNRAKKASAASAQLFISIHINSIKNKNAHGFSAWILGPANKSNYDSYEVNMEVCKRENSVIFLEDDYSTTYKDYDDSPESQIFLQLMQNAFREQSLSFAETVSSHMKGGPFTKNWGVMQGNFAVLRLASMPAVLLEFGFLSNSDDLALLRSDARINEIVSNLFDAFVEYKRNYDHSVSLDTPQAPANNTPAATAEASAKPEAPANSETTVKPETPSKTEEAPAKSETAVESQVLYGTQVLASSKLMQKNDKFFKGFSVEAVLAGNLYKYVLGASSDLATAKKNYKEIKQKFPDSFFVKVEGNQISRQKPD